MPLNEEELLLEFYVQILQVNDLWRMPYATEYNFDYHIQIVLGCNTSEVAQEKEVTINIKYRNETVILTGWLPLSQTKDCVCHNRLILIKGTRYINCFVL